MIVHPCEKMTSYQCYITPYHPARGLAATLRSESHSQEHTNRHIASFYHHPPPPLPKCTPCPPMSARSKLYEDFTPINNLNSPLPQPTLAEKQQRPQHEPKIRDKYPDSTILSPTSINPHPPPLSTPPEFPPSKPHKTWPKPMCLSPTLRRNFPKK